MKLMVIVHNPSTSKSQLGNGSMRDNECASEEYRQPELNKDNRQLNNSEFVANLSHELRTPLNAYAGSTRVCAIDRASRTALVGVN
jgi:signal transduction histidine kinase